MYPTYLEFPYKRLLVCILHNSSALRAENKGIFGLLVQKDFRFVGEIGIEVAVIVIEVVRVECRKDGDIGRDLSLGETLALPRIELEHGDMPGRDLRQEGQRGDAPHIAAEQYFLPCRFKNSSNHVCGGRLPPFPSNTDSRYARELHEEVGTHPHGDAVLLRLENIGRVERHARSLHDEIAVAEVLEPVL